MSRVYGHRAAGSALRCPQEEDRNVCVWEFPLKQDIEQHTVFLRGHGLCEAGRVGHLCANGQRLAEVVSDVASEDMRAVGPS